MQLMEAEPDVVPIEALYFADSGPHIIQRGTLAARPATLGRVELVSHGEHLRQAADSLERAPSATQRELRAHTLAGTFRALGNPGGGPLADRVAQFAMAAREALSSGIAVKEPWAFAAELRRAGDLLARSASSEEAALAAQLAHVAEGFPQPQHQGRRGRPGSFALLRRLALPAEIEVVARQAGGLHPLPGTLADAGERQPGRDHQGFLRPTDDDVQAPNLIRQAPEQRLVVLAALKDPNPRFFQRPLVVAVDAVHLAAGKIGLPHPQGMSSEHRISIAPHPNL
jgi:hypothetical protein